MPVRLGHTVLLGVNSLRSSEARKLVEHHVPGLAGNRFQDLGRESLAIWLEGVLWGELASQRIETLREAYLAGEPLAFAADIVVGSELTDVLIETMDIRQASGFEAHYYLSMLLKEYVEPPEPPGLLEAGIGAEIGEAAGSWADDALGAAGALDDVGGLPDVLDAAPDVLSHLEVEDIAGALSEGLEEIGLDGLGDVMASIGDLDLEKAGEVLEAVGEAAEFVADIAEALGIDPGMFLDCMLGGLGALEDLAGFLSQPDQLTGQTKPVTDATAGFDPFESLRDILGLET